MLSVWLLFLPFPHCSLPLFSSFWWIHFFPGSLPFRPVAPFPRPRHDSQRGFRGTTLFHSFFFPRLRLTTGVLSLFFRMLFPSTPPLVGFLLTGFRPRAPSCAFLLYHPSTNPSHGSLLSLASAGLSIGSPRGARIFASVPVSHL